MISRFTFFCLLLVVFSAGTLQAQYIYTFAGSGFGAGTGIGGYSGDNGPAKSARLYSPTGVGYDGAGNIYIADKSNNVVRKIAVNGIITTFAGTGTAGYSGDLGPATAARLNQPHSVAADVAGNVYIADYGNHVIRKVSITGGITTYAGSGTVGYSGDLGPAITADLHSPKGVAVDSLDNLYIADAGNHTVRKVTPSGIITTIAGTGVWGYSGNGGMGASAMLNTPSAVAVDPFGQVYIADFLNNVVRKVDASGIISNFAGNGLQGFSGDGGTATNAMLHNPSGVAVFGFGPVYISDQGNNAIRMVNSSGTIVTSAGSYTNGYSGDGGVAVTAQLSSPKGIAVDALNRLFIADYDNNVIRVVQHFTAIPAVSNASAGIKVYPNPSHGSFNIEVPVTGITTAITVMDMLGRTVQTTSGNTVISVNNLPSGNYILKATSGDKTWREKIEVW